MEIGFNPYQNSFYRTTDSNGIGKSNAASGPSSPSENIAPAVKKQQEYNDPTVRMKKKAGTVECETCKNRKYQDGSNDPGVSFKTPGHIDPQISGAAVMAHEQEHVRNETAKAASENRKVVSQSVKLETSVCPECGRVYVSGGETRTVTKSDANSDKKDYFMDNFKKLVDKSFGKVMDIKV